ncbi:TPA: ABC transporter permease [Vibrio cholerae]|nr:ABC transporter permease [Vibrio cholerae]
MKETVLALSDIGNSIKKYELFFMLGWQDVKQRYRRSIVGPFWLTIGMGVMIGTIALVFSHIFKSDDTEFVPFLAVGIIIWTFISTAIIEGCSAFIAAEAVIKNLNLPFFIHILKLMWRNSIILFHNSIILVLMAFFYDIEIGVNLIISLLGFILLTLNLCWIVLILSCVCTRYRDLPQIVNSILQVVFYLTPIIWMPSVIADRTGFNLIDFNPIYHLIEIVRAPVLGMGIPYVSYAICTLMLIFGSSISLFVLSVSRRKIAYWL